MPYIIRPRGVRRLIAGVLGSAILICAAPAVAGAACQSSPSSTLLAKFGDNAAYTLLTGASFESGAPGWSLSRAEVLGEEGAQGGSHALVIQPNGVAVSPAFCVSGEYPSFRFFTHQLGSARFGSSLNVSLRWTDDYGFPHSTTVAQIQASEEWALSPVLKLASALPLWMPNSTLKVKIAFQANSTAWAIDDVYIDPYSR